MRLYIDLYVITTIFAHISRAEFQRNDTSVHSAADFLDTLIKPDRYDRRIRPFFDEQKPCNVTMTIHINTISAINEVNMDYNADLIFRQSWHDPRLNYTGTQWAVRSPVITLHYSLINRIWVPDSFFRNAKEGKHSTVTVPNRFIRIHRDGNVLYSQRLLLKLACQMQFQKFPLDNQTCVVNIGSYGFATDDLVFYWKELDNISAIRVNEDLQMPDFVLTGYEAQYCNRTTITGSYTCLLVVLRFQRQFGYYLIQIYIPSVLVVTLSFVSFWIDHKSVPARISLGLLTILTVTTQSTGIRLQLARVSYLKAIDVWMAACLVFVYAGLLEYAFVNVIARKAELRKQIHFSKTVIGHRRISVHSDRNADVRDANATTLEALLQKSNDNERSTNGNTGQDVQLSAMSNSPRPASIQADPSSQIVLPKPAKHVRDSAELVELLSAILFPVAFILFNIIYWMVYLNMQVEHVLK